MAKKFKLSEVEDLASRGYMPRIVKGEVVCNKEPPGNFTPQKKESVTEKLDKKQDK